MEYKTCIRKSNLFKYISSENRKLKSSNSTFAIMHIFCKSVYKVLYYLENKCEPTAHRCHNIKSLQIRWKSMNFVPFIDVLFFYMDTRTETITFCKRESLLNKFFKWNDFSNFFQWLKVFSNFFTFILPTSSSHCWSLKIYLKSFENIFHIYTV